MIRQPKLANEWQLWYFASKDAGVVHTLSRCFFWSENILWKEDIADHPTSVFLSERDLIVDTPSVRAYLSGRAEDGKLEPSNSGEDENPRVVWCTDLDHGQVFDGGPWRALLIKEILDKASRGAQKIEK